MARKYHTHVREQEAIEVVLRVVDLEEYKNAWLCIYNNMKSDKEVFYKLSNDYGSNLYILCNPEYVDKVESFLSQFGEVTSKRLMIAVFVDVECDYQDFDEDYIDSEVILGEVD